MISPIMPLLLAAHLLLVNLASAGPLVCAWLEWREGRGEAVAGRVGRRLAAWSLAALVAGGLLGLLMGWLDWRPELSEALRRLSHKVYWGGIEYVFSLVLLAVHLAWWRRSQRGRPVRCLLLLAAGTNLLYHFPFLFAVMTSLMEQNATSGAEISAAEFRSLMAANDVLAQVAHFTLASGAVSGAAMIWMAVRDETFSASAKWGARLALVATALQLPVGLWLLTAVSASAQQRLMGGDAVATGAFLASLVSAFLLLHYLSAVSFRHDSPRARLMSVGLMLAVVVLMSVTLSRMS